MHSRQLTHYTYLQSSVNLDFEPGTAALTNYNAADKRLVKKGEVVLASDPNSVKAYSNLAGIFVLDVSCLPLTDMFFDAIQRAKARSEPSYD